MSPDTVQKFMKTLLWGLTGLTVGVLVFIIAYIFVHGLTYISWNFLVAAPENMGREGGIFFALASTFYLTLVALLIATPLGVGSAIYLTEYTREGITTRIIRFGAECLAGIPSIILGLFGFVVFVMTFKMGWSILSGGLTLAIMILPTIIRTTEEALKAVPYDFREVSFSLGGSRWQTVTQIVLPAALPGILTGIILSIGRSIGETAAVIFTAGSSLRVPTSLFDPGRTMAVHFYILAREGISMSNAYATAAILIFSILIINISAYSLMQRFIRRSRA